MQELMSDSMEQKIEGSGEVIGLWAGVVTRRVTVGDLGVLLMVFFFFFLVLGVVYIGVFSL